MRDAANKVREPVAWLVVAGLGVAIVLRVVGLVQALAQSAEYAMSPLEQAGLGVGEGALLLVVVAACALLAPRSRHATAIAWAAFAVVVIGLVCEAGFHVLLLTRVAPHIGAGPAVLQGVQAFTGPLVLAGVAWALTALAKGEIAERPALESAPASSAADQSATTWHPDHATGAAWSTAAGAASGAQASGWGVPGQGSGWTPQAAHQPGGHRQGQLPPAPAPAGSQQAGQQGQQQAGQQDQQGPPIIYPDAANDTTQFRGQWDPRPKG